MDQTATVPEIPMTMVILERFEENEQEWQYFLGLGQRSLVKDKRIGYGGKVEAGESIRGGAVREVFQEGRVVIDESDLVFKGVVRVHSYDVIGKLKHVLKIYYYTASRWQGTLQDSDEVKDGRWFTQPPFADMFQETEHLWPYLVRGEFFEVISHKRSDGSASEITVISAPLLHDS